MSGSEPFDFAAMNETLASMREDTVALKSNLNDFFLLIMAIIIFLMQAGFAFLEAGSVRSKNTTNILLKNMVESCIGGLSYWIIGWAFAYGSPSNPFIGFGEFASPPQAKYSLWFFQFVFAATTSTIVSGAVAERCDFTAFIVYSMVLTGFVYPVVTHWAWADDGWLNTLGYKDFAGSGVVHCVGGSFALVGAFLLGPREGRFDGKITNKISGHSVALVSLGGFILMFGFFAFNGGSKASITEPGDGLAVARGMFNTIISGACGGLISMIVTRFISGKWSLLVTINGILAGMVAICAGCDSVYHWGAAAIGVCAGLVYIGVSTLVIIMRIDDPLDAVAVHLGGGCIGVILQPLFDFNDGVFLGGFSRVSGLNVAWNFIGLICIVAWTVVWGFIVFGGLQATGLLRVSSEVERKGLDIFKHGEPVYPAAAYGHEWGDDWDSENNKGGHDHPEVEALNLISSKKANGGSQGGGSQNGAMNGVTNGAVNGAMNGAMNGVIQRRQQPTKSYPIPPVQALVVQPIDPQPYVEEPIYGAPNQGFGGPTTGYYNPATGPPGHMMMPGGQGGFGYGGGSYPYAGGSYFVNY